MPQNRVQTMKTAGSTSVKLVYRFAEGGASMADLLGGKGANLAEMGRLGLPLAPGFPPFPEARRPLLHAGDDGHRAKPGAERRNDAGAGTGDGRPALRSGFLSPVHPDFR